jgi:hypothetical protein
LAHVHTSAVCQIVPPFPCICLLLLQMLLFILQFIILMSSQIPRAGKAPICYILRISCRY